MLIFPNHVYDESETPRSTARYLMTAAMKAVRDISNPEMGELYVTLTARPAAGSGRWAFEVECTKQEGRGCE